MTTEITKILKGFKQFSENPYEDSVKFLKEYLEVEESDEAFFEMGKALFFNGDYDESIEYLEKSHDPKKDAYLGLSHYKKEDYKKAIDHFRKFLKNNENETILTYLMLSYEMQKDFESAIECGEDLIEINWKNTSIWIRLADYHFKAKQYENCLECIGRYEKSLDNIYYYNRKLKFKKGLALFNLKRYEDAIDAFKDIRTVEAYRMISKSYERLGKPSKAVRYLMKIYETDKNIETLFEVNKIHFKNRSYRSAINVLRDILEIEPENERALEMIGEAHINVKEEYEAIEYLKKLLEINSKNMKAYSLLMDAYFNRTDIPKVIETIERGLAVDPTCADLLNCKLCLSDCDSEEFKRTYEIIIQSKPNNTENYLILINECLSDGEEDRARRYYERMLFYNPAFEKSFDEILEDFNTLYNM